MIEIDLLPERSKKRTKESLAVGAILKSKFVPFLGAAICVLILLQAALIGAMLANRRAISSLAEKERTLMPDKKLTDALLSEEKSFDARIAYIDQIYAKRILWSKKLNELSSAITSGIWLYALSIDRATVDEPISKAPGAKTKKYITRNLLIKGTAVSTAGDETALIGKFVKSLKDNEDFLRDFSDVTLISTKREKENSVDVMAFSLTCPFKEREEAF